MFDSIVKILKAQYILFWLLPVCFITVYETDLLEVGIYAGNAQLEYMLETFGILLTIICVPSALKLFNMILTNHITDLDLSAALKYYVRWSAGRLLILELAVMFNLCVYYLLMSNVGILCGAIALTASFFCAPGKKRLCVELHISEE